MTMELEWLGNLTKRFSLLLFFYIYIFFLHILIVFAILFYMQANISEIYFFSGIHRNMNAMIHVQN